MISDLLNWLNGWRYDLDGWLVRAKRNTDPEELCPSVGFVSDCAVAVRTPVLARRLDRAALAQGGGE